MLPFDDIEIKPMQNTATGNRYLVYYRNRYLEANQVTIDLLHCLKEADNVEDAAATYVVNSRRRYSKTQIVDFVNNNLIPRLEAVSTAHYKKFLWQTELLSSETVENIAKHLTFMFKKSSLLTIMAVAIVVDSQFLFLTPNLFQYTESSNLYLVFGLLFCLCVSSFFHELGHASACSFYGIKHGGIGVGLYLTFPVLYTDVNNAWMLPRPKRCVINFAGVYFQSAAMILLIGLYHIFELDFIKFLLLMINVGFVFVLNPFFKFDGYWLTSDVIGVSNLHKKSIEFIKHLLWRLMHRQTRKPLVFEQGRCQTIAFITYSILSTIFFLSFFFYIIPLFIYNFAQTFPVNIERMVMYLSADIALPFSLLRDIVSQSLFMVLVVIMLTYPLYVYLRTQLYARKK